MNEEDRGEIILVNGLRPLIEVQAGAYRVTDNREFGDLLLYTKTAAGYSLPTSLKVPFFLERNGILFRCEGLSKMPSGRANLFVRECMPTEQHVAWWSLVQLDAAILLESQANCAPVNDINALDAIVGWLWKLVGGQPQTVRSARSFHPTLADLTPLEVFKALHRNGKMVLLDGVVAFAESKWLESYLESVIEKGLYRQEVYVNHGPVPTKHLLWAIKS